MNIISNKYKLNKTGEWAKHPRPFLKRLGNKRLRLEAQELEESPKYRKKAIYKKFRSDRFCPFCLANIFVQNLGLKTKRHGECKKCGAIKIGKRICPSCKGTNIWRSNKSFMCKRCGKVYDE